jgi:hypothetical protein
MVAMPREQWSLGADPEVFVGDVRTGEVTPIVGMIGGSKQEPIPIADSPKGYFFQEDNVMAEYNIPPCYDARDFTRAIHHGLAALRKVLPEHIDAVRGSEYMFKDALLQTDEAKLFGCAPDFDAYSGDNAQRAVVDTSLLVDTGGEWRMAGGHVHIGLPERILEEMPRHVLAMFCDAMIGLPSVSVDKQPRRRTIYGQSGTYRPTEYGIEYRVLSNFWLFDRAYTMNVATAASNLCQNIINDVMHNSGKSFLRAYEEAPWHDIRVAIDTQDEQMASDLISFFFKKHGLGVHI